MPPQPTDNQFLEVSYSLLEQTQSLDLSSLPVIDLAIWEILNYSPPPLEGRFPLPPSLEEEFPLPPLLNQLPTSPFQSNPESIDWDRLFRLYSFPFNEGDRIVIVCIPRNPTPYIVLYKHLPMCSCTTFLASNTQYNLFLFSYIHTHIHIRIPP